MADFSKFLIASDLDGTFLGDKGRLVQRNLDVIARYNEKGGLFTFNTGRPHITTVTSVPMADEICNSPSSHCNGAYLYNFQTKEFFLAEFLSEGDVAEFLNFSATYCPDLAIRANAREEIRILVPEGCEPPQVPGCDSITFDRSTQGWRLDDWFKLVFVSDAERIQKVRQDFENVFGNRFGKACSSARALEVQLARSSKAVGLEKWL